MEPSSDFCFRDPLKRMRISFYYVVPITYTRLCELFSSVRQSARGMHGTRKTRLGGLVYIYRPAVMLKCEVDVLQRISSPNVTIPITLSIMLNA